MAISTASFLYRTVNALLLLALGICIYLLASAQANASSENEYEGRLRNIAQNDIKKWANAPQIIEAIKAQNDIHNVLSLAEIDKLDREWQLQINNVNKPLIKRVTENDLSLFLKQKQLESDGLYREIMVVDNRGLVVGSSIGSTDYWQGDEAKWLRTYKVGAGAIFIDNVKYDDSAQAFQAQVSLTISEGDEPIGSITVGVDTEQMDYRNR